MVASHNEDTIRFAIEMMNELDIKPEDKVEIGVIWYCCKPYWLAGCFLKFSEFTRRQVKVVVRSTNYPISFYISPHLPAQLRVVVLSIWVTHKLTCIVFCNSTAGQHRQRN